MKTKPDMVTVNLTTPEVQAGGSEFQTCLVKVSKTLSQKQEEKEKDQNIAHVVECLFSTHDALSSIPNTEGNLA
jgi:primosomal protein N''